ncbi:MAG: SusC/RagA family TonB-linked outer membrane protein [Prolixibacteraceae bacterium]|nr:SusC/RagA family TonB-linked outer membrane protein [Prolixibacteraceae bacterium]
MKKKYIHILLFLCFVAIVAGTKVIAQNMPKENKIRIESVVVDEKGTPIAGATVYGNEGAVVAKTDDSGKFTISVYPQTDLLIESKGYESGIFRSGEISNLNAFTLKYSKFYFGENDDVNVAFGKVKKGGLVNAISIITPSKVLAYDNIQNVADVLNGQIPGLLGSTNIRGLGTPLLLVDGLPRSLSNVSLNEIEEITVLKDINSAVLYGSEAVNGVIMITTKRGKSFKKEINVMGYYGIATPTALPEYLSSADYMELYNEAKLNDGLQPQYDAATIANYRNGNPYRYPNVDYYSNEYLRSFRPFSKVMTELSGGNDVATYYSNVGWEQSGSLLDFGAGQSAKSTRFNARGNVDMKINYWIKSSIDAVAVLNSNKGPVGDYWGAASTLQPNLFSPLIPISLIDPENKLVKGRKNDVGGQYLLGGTSSYTTNPIANGFSGGESENIQRTFSFDNRIDFDLNQFVKGLAFHTNVSFDFYTIYNQSITNSYSVYNPVWSAAKDSIVSLTQYGSDVRSGSQNVDGYSFTRRFGLYAMFDYDRTFNGIHHVTGALLGFGNRYKVQGDFQGTKNVNLGLKLAYSLKDKYLVDFSSAYVNSTKLAAGNRGAFSPSLGLAWVISSEKFMSSVSAIDYLKLRLSGGVLNSDLGIDGFFYYDNRYANSGSYSWFEGTWSNSGTISSNGGNLNLGFEKRKEINFGFEGMFLDKKLSVDANVFASEYYDQITRPTTKFPSYYANFIPYQNFDSNAYRGAEIGVSYCRNVGDLTFVVGANAMYATSEVMKRDEIYANDYQYRVGHPVDARFGLVADGFFMDQADIDGHEIQAFGKVKPGDIKYVDQNGDGVIDSDDEVQIGRWQAPFSYGLNFKVTYKNLTFYVRGNGRTGADGYISDNYYWVDGNDKYSTYILDRWTETTKTSAKLPRLSSLSNTNNYRSSTFWLYKDNYFTFDRAQLTYDVPEKTAGMLKMKQLSLFANASNLLTISKYREIRELRIGAEPYYRSFSLGLKAMF